MNSSFVYHIPTKVYFGESQLQHLGKELKNYGTRVLLVYGGGSVIDATKFIGAAAFYEGDVWDLVTRKASITNCLPIVTILTLAATGSEMNAGGVISNLDTQDKIGMGAA